MITIPHATEAIRMQAFQTQTATQPISIQPFQTQQKPRGTMLKSIPCYYQILRTFQNAQVYEDQAELEGIIKQAAKERLRLERQLAQRPVCTEFSYIVVISEICSPVMEIRQLLKNSSELLISRVQNIRIKH